MPTHQTRNGPLRFLSRLLTKLLMVDGFYLRRKLLLQYALHGPEERLHLGENTDPNDTVFNTMSGHIHVGDFTIFGHHCQVLTGTHPTQSFLNDRKEHPREGRDIRIGRGVWIGSGAIILGGIEIADHSVIAAGSVVRTNCALPGIYAGNPAVLVKPITPPEQTGDV